MLKKFTVLFILGLLLAAFISYAFAYCNIDNRAGGQRPGFCQSCCKCSLCRCAR